MLIRPFLFMNAIEKLNYLNALQLFDYLLATLEIKY